MCGGVVVEIWLWQALYRRGLARASLAEHKGMLVVHTAALHAQALLTVSRVRFRVRFQAVKVPIFGGFPVENPTNKATASKALLRGISLSEYGSEGFRVRLRRSSEYGSVAYLVEKPTRETRAEQYSDTVLSSGRPTWAIQTSQEGANCTLGSTTLRLVGFSLRIQKGVATLLCQHTRREFEGTFPQTFSAPLKKDWIPPKEWNLPSS